MLCTLLFGRGGAAVIIGSIIDLPTLFTILIARYARTNLRVAIWTVVSLFVCEAIQVNISPVYQGQLFGVHLLIQGIIALLVRIRFKKQRPIDEVPQPFFTRRKKILLATLGTLLCVFIVLLVIKDMLNPEPQRTGFSDLDRRVIAMAAAFHTR